MVYASSTSSAGGSSGRPAEEVQVLSAHLGWRLVVQARVVPLVHGLLVRRGLGRASTRATCTSRSQDGSSESGWSYLTSNARTFPRRICNYCCVTFSYNLAYHAVALRLVTSAFIHSTEEREGGRDSEGGTRREEGREGWRRERGRGRKRDQMARYGICACVREERERATMEQR